MVEVTPKMDIVFKIIFGTKKNEDILKDFLESILEIEIKELNLDLATELLPDFKDGKLSRIDVRAELEDGTQIDVEIQSDKKRYSEARCFQYWSKLYSNNIEKSGDCNSLKKTICIWIVDGTVYPDIEKYHTTWNVGERELGITGNFGKMEFHIIELQKFRKMCIMKPKKKDFWLWFIDYTNMEMIEMGSISNEKIAKAREELEKIRADKELMDIIRRQEIYEWDQATSLNNARQEGIEQGKAEGKAEEAKAIAKKMIEMKIDIEAISEATGLSIDEIKKLRLK